MMKLSLADQSFHRFGIISHPLEGVFRFAKAAGFDGIELTETIRTRLYGPAHIRALVEQFDMPVTSVHQSLTRMVWSTLGSIERLLRRARDVGARCAVVHLASVHRFPGSDRFFARVRALEEHFGLPVAFENAMAQFARLKFHALHHAHDPKRFRATIERHRLNATYDLGHMGSLAPDPAAYFDTLGDRVVNIHLQDYQNGFDHLPLGTGSLPLERFLRRLVETNYQGLVTLEVFLLHRRPFLRLTEIEQHLSESLAYFRRHTGAA